MNKDNSQAQLKEDYGEVICPVCGNKTYGLYWICSHCGWEYDGTSGNQYSDCNKCSAEEFKKSLDL